MTRSQVSWSNTRCLTTMQMGCLPQGGTYPKRLHLNRHHLDDGRTEDRWSHCAHRSAEVCATQECVAESGPSVVRENDVETDADQRLEQYLTDFIFHTIIAHL